MFHVEGAKHGTSFSATRGQKTRGRQRKKSMHMKCVGAKVSLEKNKGLLKIYHSRSTKKRKSLYNFAVFSLCWCSTLHVGFTMVPFALSTSAHPLAEMESIVGIAMLQDSSHRCNKFVQIHQGYKKTVEKP